MATLGLAHNSISDLSVLAGLTNLERLGLRRNRISDLSPLAGLTNLTRVDLRHNSISDISPLVANTGVGSEDEVVLNDNPLNYAAINTDVPALKDRGVMVEFDNVVAELVDIPDPNLRAAIENALGKASGATITTTEMANLPLLNVQNADISDLTGVEYATSLTGLLLGGNSISDISAVTGLTNLIALDLQDNSYPISPRGRLN